MSNYENYKETIKEEKEEMSLWEKIKIIGGILSVIVGIVIIYMANTGELDTVTNDIISNVSRDANPYIEMVQETTPFDDGRSYKEAFAQSFDSNEWTYFSSGEERIVQIISRHEEYDLQFTTQISLTPIEDSDGDYWIEPYSMRIDDYQLSTDEMSLFLLGIFDDEVSQALNEIFAY